MSSKYTYSESSEEDADWSNVRVYSDFILYFCKSGVFQHHPLLDGSRRKGVISLLGSERVTKMTSQRRLRPVLLTLTPGVPEQRVYLFAICRESKCNCNERLYPTVHHSFCLLFCRCPTRRARCPRGQTQRDHRWDVQCGERG